MPRLNPLDAVQSVISDLTKEGNTVARTRQLPAGRNADKGFDTASFNAGMRYAMQRVSTAIKQVRAGTFKPTDTARKAPAKKAAAKRTAPTATKAKKAPAKKATARKAPAKRTAKVATVTPIANARPKVIQRRMVAR